MARSKPRQGNQVRGNGRKRGKNRERMEGQQRERERERGGKGGDEADE